MPSEQYKTLSLYYFPLGTPSRHVMLTAKVLKLELNAIHLDLLKGEHMKRDFLQINPEHKVPTLKDNEFVLSESRAIMTYLAEKYGKNESLYPKDPEKRALINQRLFFDISTLQAPINEYYRPIIFGSNSFAANKMEDIQKAFKLLDHFLGETEYVAGDTMTVADLAIISTVATAVTVIDFRLNPYPNVDKWYKTLKTTLPGYKEIIEDNCSSMKTFLNEKKNKK